MTKVYRGQTMKYNKSIGDFDKNTDYNLIETYKYVEKDAIMCE